jgi:hypothetical protein
VSRALFAHLGLRAVPNSSSIYRSSSS